MRHGRPALVTGVEHPEGAHAARTLAEHGFDVVAHSFTPEAAERIARDITSGGGRATAVVADLTIGREVDRLFTTVEDIHGHVDTVVHAAWIPGPESTGTSLETIHPHDWHRFVHAHLGMVFTTVRRAMQSMNTSGRAGSIVTVVGMGRSATETGDSTLARQVIDGAIEAFTVAAARDLGACSVQVTSIRLVDELPTLEHPDERRAPDFDTALVRLADPVHHGGWSGRVLTAHAALPAAVH
ncbi:SDR family NAD(P)-dependent oxidoreductase [Rhodococcus koreensis]|uniref:SDR family NAD(P)-dependent oxidoreductase n=1 Tax=Rhodococcus koreensis TaxID=99653 RepID=UPI00197EAA35|nr:SDR family oxidoreductase [Rhodococcus koreensis]QSE80434.1 SDR family oxidoreductase [Rhodococcus koreensis]